MPMPWSRTLKTASPFSATSCSAIRPPEGVYFTAFSSRFETTCSNRTGSPLTHTARSGRSSETMWWYCSMRARAASTTWRTRAPKSTDSRLSSIRPRLMRATSSSSSTSRTKRRVCRSSKSYAFIVPGSAVPPRKRARVCVIGASGFLSSCASMARNSSLRRLPSRRLSVLARRSVMSSTASRISCAGSASPRI